jgi:uncharacterized protein
LNAQPLTDAEFEQVAEVLSRFGGRDAMNLEEIDGFFAALIAGPANVLPSEYLPGIWGDAMINEDAFSAQSTLHDFLSLLMKHWNHVCATLHSDDVYVPLLLEDEGGIARGNDWATGFIRGMDLRNAEWVSLLADDDHSGSLVPIFTLAHENNPDPEMRPFPEPISSEVRQQLIIGAAAGVIRTYKYFRGEDFSPRSFSVGTTFRRLAPKVGRNERCPCGSGKKYKACCGSKETTTLH